METTTDSAESDAANNYTMVDKHKPVDTSEPEQAAMADLAVINTDIKSSPITRFLNAPELLSIVAQMVSFHCRSKDASK